MSRLLVPAPPGPRDLLISSAWLSMALASQPGWDMRSSEANVTHSGLRGRPVEDLKMGEQ